MKTKPNKTKIYGKINTPDKRLKIIKLTRGNGLFRATNEVTEIIIGDRYECYITGNNFSNGSHLMGAVKKDAQKFVESGKKLPEFPKFPVRKTNDKYDFNNGILVGTDVDHAYWRIAYNFGIISESTYYNGLKKDEYKVTRLTALSILGRRKVYQKIENGEVLDEYVEYPENEQLKSIFTFIRTYAYYVMHEISELLGCEFESYNTDCVYYRDTFENRKLVSNYLDDKLLLYKWLTYSTDEETNL